MIAHAASLDVIRSELEKSDTYSFTVQLFDKNGEGDGRLKRCTFLYLNNRIRSCWLRWRISQILQAVMF